MRRQRTLATPSSGVGELCLIVDEVTARELSRFTFETLVEVKLKVRDYI